MASEPQRNWLGHTFQQAPWRTQTQGTSLVLATVVLVVVVGTLYLAQASRTSATGRRLQELEAERQTLEQQNAQLRAEIAALRSVPRLIGEAEALGYRKAESDEVWYLEVDAPPPLPEDITVLAGSIRTTHLPESDSVPVYDETLDNFLAQQLQSFRAGLSSFLETTFGRTEDASG